MNGTLDIKDCVNTHCPNSSKPVTAEGLTLYKGKVVGFCNTNCRAHFENIIKKFEANLGN